MTGPRMDPGWLPEPNKRGRSCGDLSLWRHWELAVLVCWCLLAVGCDDAEQTQGLATGNNSAPVCGDDICDEGEEGVCLVDCGADCDDAVCGDDICVRTPLW